MKHISWIMSAIFFIGMIAIDVSYMKKINNLNEAVSWLTKVASATQKILCLKRSVHPLKKESLAEYFVRTSKFLPDSKIIVIEIDDEGITRKLTH